MTLVVQILVFVAFSVSALVYLIKNFTKLALALQKFYERNIEKAWGRGSFETPSLWMCKLHIGFLGFMAIVLFWSFCFAY